VEIISTTDGIDFGISKEFQSQYLTPIIQNLLYKAENQWDDYDEVYHCSKLIQGVKKNKDMNMDFHIMKKDEKYLGIALITSGKIDYSLFFKEQIDIEEKDNEVLIFNYFHIAQEGRGNGEVWFNNIIKFYKEKNYKAIYLKSSHSKVFSMYNRLGKEIGQYSSKSDNDLFEREGKIFKIYL
jgi:hypothetical protein